MTAMKVCVFGAGAIGGHIAGRLAKGGAEVSVVVRGRHLEAIQRNGLRVLTPDGEIRADVAADDDPAALGPQDAVIVTAKAHSLPAIADTIAPLLGPDTPVAFVTNGLPWWYFFGESGPRAGRRIERLDPRGALWRNVGPERAIGGVVFSACTVVEPGVVEVVGTSSWLYLGEPDGSATARLAHLAAAVRAGGFTVEETSSIRDSVWRKLAGNMAGSILSILTQSNRGGIHSDQACAQFAADITREAQALAAAYGHPITQERGRPGPGVPPGTHKASILLDLEAGRPMEVDAILRAPLDLAAEAGIAMPVFSALAALALLRVRSAGLDPAAAMQAIPGTHS